MCCESISLISTNKLIKTKEGANKHAKRTRGKKPKQTTPLPAHTHTQLMNNKLNNKQITLYITFAPHLSHTNTWPECHVVKFSSTNNFCIWKLCTLHSFGFGKNKIFLLTLLTLQTTLFRSFSFAYMVKVFDVFWINNRNKKGPKKGPKIKQQQQQKQMLHQCVTLNLKQMNILNS